MGRKSDFSLAQKKIEAYLKSSPSKSFSEKILSSDLDKNRDDWKISERKTGKNFTTFITQKKLLYKTEFRNENGGIKPIFSKSNIDNFTIFSTLHNNSYFTHYTAMFLNELTLQIPKTYYLNFEHYSISERGEISQNGIDRIFSKPQRKSSKFFTYGGNKIILLNGKYTNKLGVKTKKGDRSLYEYTNLERTLIDIAIRPVYSGGVFEVLNAYKTAKKMVNMKRLINYLEELDYIYPYKQVIGFYLEKAGYPEKTLSLFETEKIKFKFYLTYDIRKDQFSDRWQLHYPKGM